uniref:Uncharacterized protein n=1 Tax=Leersia perrieri TaxID=77586 RepID=A0A0D9WZB9_9ORYZ
MDRVDESVLSAEHDFNTTAAAPWNREPRTMGCMTKLEEVKEKEVKKICCFPMPLGLPWRNSGGVEIMLSRKD